jgi:hypothetical protein
MVEDSGSQETVKISGEDELKREAKLFLESSLSQSLEEFENNRNMSLERMEELLGPNFASVLASYLQLTSQEQASANNKRLVEQNNRLQKWLAVFAGISCLAVILGVALHA